MAEHESFHVGFKFRRGDFLIEVSDNDYGVRLHRDVQRDAETLWLKAEELHWLVKVAGRIETLRAALKDIEQDD